MKRIKYLSSREKKQSEVRLLTIILVAFLLCTIANTWILQRALASRHTVLIPAGGITEELRIKNDSADEKYLRLMAYYVMNLLGNYTPMTCRQQFEQLLFLYEPSLYPQAVEKYMDLAKDLEYSKASSTFGLNLIRIEHDRELIDVHGLLSQYINDKLVERKSTVYRIHYAVRDGRFVLQGIEEKGEK